MVSFLTEVPSFYNVEMPMDYPIIAPFYSDIDIRRTGQVEISPFYSDIDIRRTGQVDISPFYSDIDIRRTGQVDISPFYSNIDIRRTGQVDVQISRDGYQKTDMKGQV